ncbi:NUDIX domain-containing protein [Dyadobacter sp. CY323]|uniref:NUDIX domain-containing protein n=1 Tax=Dyadobacter sp. CY323 TaxID=2907302 RepID=UPI001F1A897F|nr:NUDIX domain-containing protein [Dyadobacter sp. CY323]MCE6989172.1 NUDIX domain-containing protein [Dyadobacter sp. CY323]
MNVRPSAIILQNESILTLRYCYGNTEVYALPGGNPDPGECLTEALRRELNEELGVNAAIGEMVCCGEVIWPEIKKETLHILFQAEIGDQIPVLNPEHTTALGLVWLSICEAQSKLLYPNVGKEIADYLSQTLNSVHIGPISQPYIS